jgi:hypothetical protein
MIRKLITTDNNTATTILRLVLGVIFFAHGAQKLLGWFGGYGFTGTMGFFTGAMHIPALFAFLAIAAEFFGGLGLIFGFPDPNRGIRNLFQYARGHSTDPSSLRFLYELDRSATSFICSCLRLRSF